MKKRAVQAAVRPLPNAHEPVTVFACEAKKNGEIFVALLKEFQEIKDILAGLQESDIKRDDWADRTQKQLNAIGSRVLNTDSEVARLKKQLVERNPPVCPTRIYRRAKEAADVSRAIKKKLDALADSLTPPARTRRRWFRLFAKRRQP